MLILLYHFHYNKHHNLLVILNNNGMIDFDFFPVGENDLLENGMDGNNPDFELTGRHQ